MDTDQTSRTAQWLLVAFACVVMIGQFALTVRREGDVLPGLLFSAFATCWLSTPVALATVLVMLPGRYRAPKAFLFCEVAAISSSAWLLPQIFLDTDAQGGIAIAFLPIIQIMAICAYAGLTFVVLSLAGLFDSKEGGS